MSETRYIISDAAKMIDVEPHVLRYWEEELGMEIPRNEMGHRYYTDKEVRLFTMVRDLKNKGFQLKAIKMILSAIDSEENSNKIISLEQIRKNYENAQKQEDEAEPMLKKSDALNADNEERLDKEILDKKISDTSKRVTDDVEDRMIDEMKKQSETLKTNLKNSNTDTSEADRETGLSVGNGMRETSVTLTSEEKMAHFKYMMDSIVMQALRKNNKALEDQISDQISDRIISEMDMLLKLQEEREEERYRNIDELIRQKQQGYKEAAATKVPAFSSKKEKKKWFKSREF